MSNIPVGTKVVDYREGKEGDHTIAYKSEVCIDKDSPFLGKMIPILEPDNKYNSFLSEVVIPEGYGTNDFRVATEDDLFLSALFNNQVMHGPSDYPVLILYKNKSITTITITVDNFMNNYKYKGKLPQYRNAGDILSWLYNKVDIDSMKVDVDRSLE